GGFGFPRDQASAIVGIYAASVYLASLPGGWVADRLFGVRRAIFIGAVLMSLGHLSIGLSGISGSGQKIWFFLALILIVLGTGLLKPNISSIVGDLYPEGGAKRDAGFSIFYMGINMGSIFGQIFVSFLGEKVNWHYGFGLAAIGMLFGLIQYKMTQNSLGDIGKEPKAAEKNTDKNSQRNLIYGIGFLAILAGFLTTLQFTGVIDMTTARGIAGAVGIIIVSVTLLYFLFILFFGGL